MAFYDAEVQMKIIYKTKVEADNECDARMMAFEEWLTARDKNKEHTNGFKVVVKEHKNKK